MICRFSKAPNLFKQARKISTKKFQSPQGQVHRPGVRPHSVPNVKPKIGLALGGGSARGWAHIGVIRSLEAAGIKPDCIAGTSIGALVGSAHSLGMIDELESWARSVNWRSLLSLTDISFNLGSGPLLTGIIQGESIVKVINSSSANGKTFADCRIPFGCVATDIKRGKEVWLREGKIVDAVRASISVPGLISPVLFEGPDGPVWLVDGGVMNPVPVSLAYALGADIVIAVSLNRGLIHFPTDRITQKEVLPNRRQISDVGSLGRSSFPLCTRRSQFMVAWQREPDQAKTTHWTRYYPVMSTLSIMEEEICRSRLAGNPPAIELKPRVGNIESLEFHKADEAIAAGVHCTEQMLPAIRDAIDTWVEYAS